MGSGHLKEIEWRGRGVKGSVERLVWLRNQANYLEQHGSPNSGTIPATVVLLWPGSSLFFGQFYYIPSR